MESLKDFIILIPLVIQLLGLLPIVLMDKYIAKKQRSIMICIIATVSILVAQNCVEYYTETVNLPTPMYRTLSSILGYCLHPLILVMFCQLVQPNKKHIIAKILVNINTLLYMSAIFSPITFYISKSNHFMRGPLNYTVYVISALLFIYLIYCTIYEFRHTQARIWVALSNVALVLLGTFMDGSVFYVDYPVSYLTMMIVSCTLFYYIWLRLEFVRVHEKALMADQRIKIMMSQIQPHFLYNTLATIQSLCLTDPTKAAEVTGKFGAYLRSNLDSLEKSELIPIEKELEHTRIYAGIEMMRFPKIRVEYNIEADDFSLPALTIQPLVENAIRHGVRNREHGAIEVSTKKTDENYIIVISDNGIGFDPDKPLPPEETHIGLGNVRERIERICHGTLTVDSHKGQGTVITITIPRRTE